MKINEIPTLDCPFTTEPYFILAFDPGDMGMSWLKDNGFGTKNIYEAKKFLNEDDAQSYMYDDSEHESCCWVEQVVLYEL